MDIADRKSVAVTYTPRSILPVHRSNHSYDPRGSPPCKVPMRLLCTGYPGYPVLMVAAGVT